MVTAPLHILIIDDSPDDRQSLRQLLTQAGTDRYTISESDRGDDALALCQATPLDCILLDQRLPDMDGLTVLPALRALTDTPVVLLTGEGDEAAAMEAFARGAQDALVRTTLTAKQLHMSIQRAIAIVRFSAGQSRDLALSTTMLEVMPIAVVVLDADLRIIKANQALGDMLDHPAQELPGQLLLELCPNLAELLIEPCRQVLRGKPFHDLLLRLPGTEDHATRWLTVSGEPFRDPATLRPLGLITARDISAHMHIEEELMLAQEPADHAALAIQNAQLYQAIHAAQQTTSEALARLDALVTSAPVGIAYIDRELRYQLVNPTLAAINAQPREAHLGRTIADIIPDIAPQIETLVRQVFATGESLRNVEVFDRPNTTDPTPHDWLISYFPVQGSAGTITGVGVTITDITERRRTQQAITYERQQLATILQTIDEGVMAFHPDGTIALLNATARHLADLDPEIMPTSLKEIARTLTLEALDTQGRPLPPEDWPVYRVLRGESFVGVELCLRSATSGEERWQSFSGTPAYDAAGQVILGVLTAQDITRRKTDEVALRTAYARLEAHVARLGSLITHAPIGISLLDPELRFQHINTHMAALNGIPPEAHLGRPLGEVLPVLAWDLEPIYYQVLATGEPLLNVEIRGETAAAPGIPHTWLASYFPVRVGQNPIQGVGTVVMDITERRQAELARAEIHQQLEAILQTMDEGVLAFRPDGTIVVLNAMGRQLIGLDATTAIPTVSAAYNLIQTTPIGIDGRPLANDEVPIARVLRGESFSHFEVLAHTADGAGDRWLAFSGTPVRDSTGALTLAVLTARDITQRKRDAAALQAHTQELSKTNADLTRALRLKDEFLAMMSHELRTPLNAILGMTEAMQETVYGPLNARQEQALAQIEESGQHLLRILSDILDLARIGAGVEQIERGPVDVEILCQSVMRLISGRADQKGITVLRTMSYGVEGLWADERRLTQILVNLLDNAVKFTPTGGKVGLEVLASAAQEQISFTVWDTGIGIAAHDMDRLFQPFTQVDGRLARSYEGIGLGLSLVRRLTELHGGSVQLESTPGEGSRFTILLPWSEDDNHVARSTVPAAVSVETTWQQPPRLVLADDDEITLSLYTEWLMQLGCIVTSARTGVEALIQVRAQHPDVLLLDIQMPTLDGLAVIRQIRADPAVRATPIIAVTALAMPGDRERCLAAGANAYLAKPVSLRTLLRTIGAMLSTDYPDHID